MYATPNPRSSPAREYPNDTRLPGLIQELKTNHTAAKEDADMIFSTVHRCKGMEYDEVTLLKDFINEEKLKKYIIQMGGDKITEADKNRLAEEINILYVAITRAKSTLIIPPEINPLQSVQVAQTPILQARSSYKKSTSYDDWDLYSRSQNTSSGKSKKANQGKKWTEEDEDLLVQLYNEANGLKAIASELGRGENAVRIKLINLGLLEEVDDF